MEEKVKATAPSNKRVRRRLCSRPNRAKVETSFGHPAVPLPAAEVKEFSKEIERAVLKMTSEPELQRSESRRREPAEPRAN